MKIFLLAFAAVVHSLHFYIETHQTKCFVEELPSDTMVVGKYRSEQFNQAINGYKENQELNVEIIVEELPSRTRVKQQKGASSGQFSFTASKPGSYEICISTNLEGGWFDNEKARIYLDLVVGDAAMDEDKHQDAKISELAMRARDLNHRIADIRREQTYQRTRESEFRDKSEDTNSKAVWWTILQISVLGITAVWQMRHLKNFFQAKKLV